jgi:hypothetical protein
MVWTVTYFKYFQRQWEQRQHGIDMGREGATGLICYAAKQARLWKDFAAVGMVKFKRTIRDLDFDT